MRPLREAAEEEAAWEYADAIWAERGNEHWASLNRFIVNRWSLTALRRIKRRAWQIVEMGR